MKNLFYSILYCTSTRDTCFILKCIAFRHIVSNLGFSFYFFFYFINAIHQNCKTHFLSQSFPFARLKERQYFFPHTTRIKLIIFSHSGAINKTTYRVIFEQMPKKEKLNTITVFFEKPMT